MRPPTWSISRPARCIPSGGGHPRYDANDNAIWYISENASGGTPTKVTLTGMPGGNFYGGDMTFDQSTRQIYVESERQPQLHR
jgi:hypothetical protein